MEIKKRDGRKLSTIPLFWIFTRKSFYKRFGVHKKDGLCCCAAAPKENEYFLLEMIAACPIALQAFSKLLCFFECRGVKRSGCARAALPENAPVFPVKVGYAHPVALRYIVVFFGRGVFAA